MTNPAVDSFAMPLSDVPLGGPRQLDFSENKKRQERIHQLIPGGCHTYAKGDDQFPQLSPGIIARGKGCRVWDVDGNEFIEYGMGGRAVTLGHAYEPVIEAAIEAMYGGTAFTRANHWELAAAEEILAMVPGADMVKFTKDGSTTTTAALKLSRAYTGRDMVALCGDHPFFSYDDWFIGTTPCDSGIPQSVKDLSVTFRYNDVDSVRHLFEQHPGRIACVILEPCKYEHPEDNFLHKVQELCREHGAVFILDEMITGFRMHNGGAQAYYDITPDLSTFGKAMANGFACSALMGKRHLMELGGIQHDRERVFLLSTTHGAETHALAAAIATWRTYQNEPVIERMWAAGRRLAERGNAAIAAKGMSDYVQITGLPCNLVFSALNPQGERCQSYRSLLLQEIINRGVLAPSLVVSYAHRDEDIDQTVDAFAGAMDVYARAIEQGSTDGLLVGQPSKVVYRRYN